MRAGRAFALLQLAAVDGDEGRAEALEAGIILVAGRLIDPSFASEFRFFRFYGQAIGCDAAVAASFANFPVDEKALVRVGIGSPFPPPATNVAPCEESKFRTAKEPNGWINL